MFLWIDKFISRLGSHLNSSEDRCIMFRLNSSWHPSTILRNQSYIVLLKKSRWSYRRKHFLAISSIATCIGFKTDKNKLPLETFFLTFIVIFRWTPRIKCTNFTKIHFNYPCPTSDTFSSRRHRTMFGYLAHS